MGYNSLTTGNYYSCISGWDHYVISADSLFTIGTLVINIIYFVLLDRLMMAAVQRRTGPYNVGYFGLLQSMDDGLKLVKNEVIIPKKSSCILFLVVPNLFFYCSLILLPEISLSFTTPFEKTTVNIKNISRVGISTRYPSLNKRNLTITLTMFAEIITTKIKVINTAPE